MSFSIPDWEEFLRGHKNKDLPEIELSRLKPGDRLLVLTTKTAYEFLIETASRATLSTNRLDRPSGSVRLNGCTFGASSTIKPDLVFCGGNLEFVVKSDQSIYTTTKIKALQLVEAAGETDH